MMSSEWMGEGLDEATGGPSRYPAALLGFRVLIVEDEALVSMTLEGMLGELGCVVTGVAATVSEALTEIRIKSAIDAAILDVNLRGEKVFPVADMLAERGVPFLFSTGFGPADIAQRYPESPLIHKPYGPDELAGVLMTVARRQFH